MVEEMGNSMQISKTERRTKKRMVSNYRMGRRG